MKRLLLTSNLLLTLVTLQLALCITHSETTDTQQSAVSQSAEGEASATSLHAQTEAGDPDLFSVQFPVTALATVSSAGSLS